MLCAALTSPHMNSNTDRLIFISFSLHWCVFSDFGHSLLETGSGSVTLINVNESLLSPWSSIIKHSPPASLFTRVFHTLSHLTRGTRLRPFTGSVVKRDGGHTLRLNVFPHTSFMLLNRLRSARAASGSRSVWRHSWTQTPLPAPPGRAAAAEPSRTQTWNFPVALHPSVSPSPPRHVFWHQHKNRLLCAGHPGSPKRDRKMRLRDRGDRGGRRRGGPRGGFRVEKRAEIGF